MRDHIRILGVLNIVMGAMVAIIGIVVFFVTSAIAGYIASSINASAHDAVVAAPIIVAAGMGVAVFFWLLALPAILGGWGLLNFKPWSWLLMLIVSILHLFHFPLGTALGVYGLWVLYNDDARRLLGRRSVGYGVPTTGVQPAPPPTYPSQQPPRPV
ncbi:MAG: hypothetical protein JO319_21125 [Acidobacteriaceae bacterium]|nr:hypothetical protein [Acidobacteriaceae bacterium]